MIRRLFFSLVLLSTSVAASAEDRPIRFKKDIAPILVKNCLGCHDDRKAKSGLNMSTYALLRKGGDSSGADAIVPGDPESSELVASLRPDASPRMPYKLPPLTDSEIETIRLWILQGAKFDGGSETETRLTALVDPLAGLPKIAPRNAVREPIAALAYSPKDNALAAAEGRVVRLFFENSKQTTFEVFSSQDGRVSSLIFGGDGKTLTACGGRPGMFGAIAIVDLDKKTPRISIRGHADSILSADLSPDGKLLATSSYDRLVKLWDTASGRELRTLKEHTDAVYSVAFSPDGKTLASGSGDRTVKLWDAATGKRIASLGDSTAEIYAVAFSRDGTLIFAAGVDRSIRAWKIEGATTALIRTIFAHDAPIVRLGVSRDGQTLVSAGEDRKVKLWNLPALDPAGSLDAQNDWPLGLAISNDGGRIAVGRYDGSLSIYDRKSARVVSSPIDPVGARKKGDATASRSGKPELLRDATLNPPEPRGATRGSKIAFRLDGNGIGQAYEVVFDDPGLAARIKPTDKPEPNRLDVELTVAQEARLGRHRFWVRTPLGTPSAGSFVVSAAADRPETEPNDSQDKATVADVPVTATGTIAKPGDVDFFRLEVKKDETIVCSVSARSIGSALDASISLWNARGEVLAEKTGAGVDPILTYRAPRAETIFLRVADGEFGGSPNHGYRVQIGPLPYVQAWFPYYAKQGESTKVDLKGANPSAREIVVNATKDAKPGTIVPLLSRMESDAIEGALPKSVVAEGDQAVEREPNDVVAAAQSLADFGGVSGRIDKPGDADLYRFKARKGERLIVEVFGDRLGTAIDSTIEILDSSGRRIPRAILRPTARTTVAFRDHGSSGRSMRFVEWNDFKIGDYLLIGREVTRLYELPRNPDDDAVLWGQGLARINSGRRTAFFETTPEHHAFGQTIEKVEVYPPGSNLPSGGATPTILHYRNDDGGPGFEKDSRLTFDPPADGDYLVRIEDSREFGGETFGYHLLIRRPSPDFKLSASPENPNIPRSAAKIVTVGIDRLDGFDEPVEVWVEGLPKGVTATKGLIEAGDYAAEIALSATADAPVFSDPTWKIIARGTRTGLRHEFDPGGDRAGWITVVPEVELRLIAGSDRVEIRPGGRVAFRFGVERDSPLEGRVPINVRNLPLGVRVLDIGLNGVLVTENQKERTVVLEAQPWVEPGDRPFFASGRLELLGEAKNGNGRPVIDVSRETVGRPIELVILPKDSDSKRNRPVARHP